MIVIGYPGIGKSTLAAKDHDYVDLESSCFMVAGKRHDDWYIPYCQTAEDISRQGRTVFVSSHAAVVDYLVSTHTPKSEFLVFIYPSVNLRDEWVDKLRVRFDESGLEKDMRAWMRAIKHYKEDVQVLSQAPVLSYKLPITNMNYDLKEEIEKIWKGEL